MVFPILTGLSKAQCTHGGPVTLVATGVKVLIDNGPALVSGDQAVIAGCAFTVPPGKPQPCIKGQLAMPSSKVMVGGKPVMLMGVADLGLSAEQIPGGPLIYSSVQTKVIAT